MDELDRDLAQLAALTRASLDASFVGSNDAHKMNVNRLDITRFIPNRNRARSLHHPPPMSYPTTYPQQSYNAGISPSPYNTGEGEFSPVPLPNKPNGLIPLPKEAMPLINQNPNNFYQDSKQSSFEKPDVTTPSFQDTTFSHVKLKSELGATGKSKSVDQDSEALKKIKTLTTKINALQRDISKILTILEKLEIPSNEDISSQ